MNKTYEVKIEGTTPLMQHRFDEQAEVGGKKVTRTVVQKSETPRQAAERVCYRTKEGDFYMPSACISRMLCEAGGNHKMKGSRKSAKWIVPAAILIPVDTITIRNGDGETPAEDFEVDARPVVNPPTGGRIMRFRPRFDKWCMKFNLRVNEAVLPAEFVHQLLQEGGQQLGIGDFRPQCRGPFGTFRVTHWEELKD